MKGDIRKALQQVAATTPLLLEWVEVIETFTPQEIMLTPIGKHLRRRDVAGMQGSYSIPMPALKAVDHYPKFVEAFNNMDWQGVKQYHRSVMDKINQHGIKISAAGI